MPYIYSNQPMLIKGLPENAKKIWIKAFNNAYKQYKGNEQKSIQITLTSIKNAGYKKINGIWKRWE